MGEMRPWMEFCALTEVGLEEQLVFSWVTKQKGWWQLTGIRSLSRAEAGSTRVPEERLLGTRLRAEDVFPPALSGTVSFRLVGLWA